MAKTSQKVISCEAYDIVRVDVKFKTSYKILLKILARRQPWVAHVVKTCNTNETHVLIGVTAVIKTWGDAIKRESKGICHGQSTVIGRVLRIGITGNSVCLAAYHWQIYFSVLGQCLGSASAMEQPLTAIPRHTSGQSQNWPKITTYDQVHQIFITSCTWFRCGVLCDWGFSDAMLWPKTRSALAGVMAWQDIICTNVDLSTRTVTLGPILRYLSHW